MNNIFNLTKIYTIESIGSLFSKVKKKGFSAKSIFVKLLFGFLFLLFGVNMGVMFFGYAQMLETAGMANYVFYYGIMYFNLLCLMFLSFQTQGLFFKTKDYSLLASMPIKSYQIIISKFLSLLMLCYVFELLVVVPAMVVYYLFVPITFLSVLFFVLTMAFLPMLGIFFSTIIVLVINKLSSKATNKDNVNMFLIFGVMFLLIAAFMYVNYWGLGALAAAGAIPTFLHYVFPTSSFMFFAIDQSSILMTFLMIISSVALFAISVLLLSHSYFTINRDYQNKRVATKQTVSYEPVSVLKKLVFVEFKNFINKPIYVFNTTFGMILLLLLSLALPVFYFLNTNMFLPTSPLGPYVTGDFLLVIFAFAPAMMVFMSSTTNSAISLEGQAIYFKKSLPIEFKKIALSKLIINFLVCSPVLLFFVTSLPVMIALGMSVFNILMAFAVPVLTVIFVSLFGLMVNLWFPLLNWTNVTVVVKQSMATMISILGGMFFGVAVFALYFSLGLAGWLFGTIYIVLMLALCLLFWFLINKNGKRIYETL